MRVLVTGGAGFIGSHIVDELLTLGHEPAVVDNLESGRRDNLPSDVPLFEVDIRDGNALSKVFEEIRPNWVCHQAAQMSVSRSVRDPLFDADVNIMGLLRVLDLSVRAGVERVVFASSGGVLYGNVSEPAGETHPASPISPYGIAKWVGEQYLQFYVREHGLTAVALRYSNVFGPRQNPHGEAGVVAIFSQKMLAGEEATIFGDGTIIRDYVYVTDVAAANALSLESELSEKFVPLNIGTGIATDVNTLAVRIHEQSVKCRQQAGLSEPVPEAVHGPPRAGDLQSNLIFSGKARELLTWEPSVSLADGIEQTVAWFAKRIDASGTP